MPGSPRAGGRRENPERAGGGPRAGWAPGAGEETPPHAAARPLLIDGRRGGTASTRPAATAPPPRAESADTNLTARPARERDPGPAAWPACSLTIFRPPVSVPGPRRALTCAGTSTVHAREGDLRHDFAHQPAFHPATPPDGYPASDPAPQTCRPACRPRAGRSRWSAAEYTCGGEPGLMTRSFNNHPRGAGTGAGTGTSAAKDEAAVLAASAHLTDRDRGD
jgi:hypothetical protein